MEYIYEYEKPYETASGTQYCTCRTTRLNQNICNREFSDEIKERVRNLYDEHKTVAKVQKLLFYEDIHISPYHIKKILNAMD